MYFPNKNALVFMLNFIHDLIVPEGSSGRVEYASLALACVTVVNVAACIAVRWGQPSRVFEAGAGAGVAAACLLTLLVRGTYFPRQIIGTTLVAVWGVRLSIHMFVRNARKEVLNVAVRVAWSMLCATPVVVCNTRQREQYDATRAEAIGIAAAALAICCETLADFEKTSWHAAHPARPTKADVGAPVCTTGLWAWSRHPNLFFELLFHWSIYVIVRPVEAPVVLICPTLLTVLVVFFPGGVMSQEASRERLYGLYPAYVRYKDATPALIPLPWARRILARCSPVVAEVACFEFGI